jgi:hypothetical protein
VTEQDFDNKRYGVVESVRPSSVIKCDGCAKDVPCFSQTNLPEHGFVLTLASMDYYGGFSDFFDDEPPKFLLCHDCSLALITALPLVAERLPRGLHPCDLDTPCCDYAWKWISDGQWKDNNLHFAKDGKWVPAS